MQGRNSILWYSQPKPCLEIWSGNDCRGTESVFCGSSNKTGRITRTNYLNISHAAHAQGLVKFWRGDGQFHWRTTISRLTLIQNLHTTYISGVKISNDVEKWDSLTEQLEKRWLSGKFKRNGAAPCDMRDAVWYSIPIDGWVKKHFSPFLPHLFPKLRLQPFLSLHKLLKNGEAYSGRDPAGAAVLQSLQRTDARSAFSQNIHHWKPRRYFGKFVHTDISFCWHIE